MIYNFIITSVEFSRWNLIISWQITSLPVTERAWDGSLGSANMATIINLIIQSNITLALYEKCTHCDATGFAKTWSAYHGGFGRGVGFAHVELSLHERILTSGNNSHTHSGVSAVVAISQQPFMCLPPVRGQHKMRGQVRLELVWGIEKLTGASHSDVVSVSTSLPSSKREARCVNTSAREDRLQSSPCSPATPVLLSKTIFTYSVFKIANTSIHIYLGKKKNLGSTD